MTAETKGADVLHAIAQVDVALEMAGLWKGNIIRIELREASVAIAELIEADVLLDKCEAALESHRAAEKYGEAWAPTQLELHRARDMAANRRAAALARISGAR